METAIDLNAYLRRVGFGGNLAADLHTVEKLIERHTRAIPFENLNPFLGWPVEIDLPAVERKLVHGRRGGYCFEQNALLRAVLESLGIPVTSLAARVLWQMPAGARPAQSHMMLCAEIGGLPYLADVGFGIQTPTGPLRLDTEIPQATPNGRYRILKAGGEYLVEVEVAGEWKPIYRFDLQEQTAADYKVFNWYCATHPDSHFTTDLIAARAVGDGRHTLRNSKLTFYPLVGEKRESSVAGARELRRTLRDTFGIELPETDHVERMFDKLFVER